MVDVNYIMNPDSFSLYHRSDTSLNDGEIGIFGDNHLIAHGDTNYAIPIAQYLKERLEDNPELHVYAEIPPLSEDEGEKKKEEKKKKEKRKREGKEGKGGLEYTNKGLSEVRDLSNNRTFIHRGRIHNIDPRHDKSIISKGMYDSPTRDSVDHVAEIVEDYVEERAEELLPLFREAEEQAMDEISLEHGVPTYGDKLYAKQLLMNPMVDAEAVHIIKRNPHNARDMIFYVGSAHKDGIERYLEMPNQNRTTLIYKRRAEKDEDRGINNPVVVTRSDQVPQHLFPAGVRIPKPVVVTRPEPVPEKPKKQRARQR